VSRATRDQDKRDAEQIADKIRRAPLRPSKTASGGD
jgi:hypothetical protein